MERHAPGFENARAMETRALERWENEGGKVPELLPRNRSKGLAGGGVAPAAVS
jgi:hypothetical protein